MSRHHASPTLTLFATVAVVGVIGLAIRAILAYPRGKRLQGLRADAAKVVDVTRTAAETAVTTIRLRRPEPQSTDVESVEFWQQLNRSKDNEGWFKPYQDDETLLPALRPFRMSEPNEDSGVWRFNDPAWAPIRERIAEIDAAKRTQREGCDA